MALSPSATVPKDRSNLWIAGLLMVVLFGFGGLLLLRHARALAQRERIAAEERSRSPQPVSEDRVAARAIANYLAKVQVQLHYHEIAFRRLEQKKIFSWDIRDRADLETDRQMIHDFLTTNAQLTESLQYGADLIRAELDTAKVSASLRDSTMALYTKSQAPSRPLQLRLRQCDQALGERALDVLELLDWSWGAWERDDASGRIDFNNLIVQATFKDYAGKTQAAAVEREAALAELTAYERRQPQR